MKIYRIPDYTLDAIIHRILYGEIEKQPLGILGENCPTIAELSTMDPEQQTRLAAAATVAAVISQLPGRRVPEPRKSPPGPPPRVAG